MKRPGVLGGCRERTGIFAANFWRVPPGARTVAKGDTLGSIAAKFYKNKARWPKIRDANFPGAKGTPPIKSGQELIIP